MGKPHLKVGDNGIRERWKIEGSRRERGDNPKGRERIQ